MHTTEILRGGARDFCTVLDQVLSYFLWEVRFIRVFAGIDFSTEGRQSLHNALLESSLFSIRILNDFFRPRSRPSDIRAEDYVNYISPAPFLSAAEGRDRDKHVAHLTTERATFPQKPWQIYDMLRRTHDACLTFLLYLKASEGQAYYPRDAGDIDSRIETCQRIENEMRQFLDQPKV